ncbi:MAG: hypothetical protein ACK5O2_07430 [Microthrixaceae bacterium]
MLIPSFRACSAGAFGDRRLGITHFVDDRLDVHEHLVTVQRRHLFTGVSAHTSHLPAFLMG